MWRQEHEIRVRSFCTRIVALEVELLIMIVFSVSCLKGEDGHGGGVE